jgi:hypothetical protein
MSESVKQAIQRMRLAERNLAISLFKAARSGTIKRYDEVAKQIARAEERMRLLELELRVA